MKRETPTIRLLQVLKTDGQPPLVLLDEGQDFEALFAQWCDQDDAFCDGKITDREWRDIATFLTERGIVILDPIAIQDLGDYYGLS